MSPFHYEGERKVWLDDYSSHVDRLIREAQERGEFDNLPGAGKPLDLGRDDPFEAEWASAFRLAKNAGTPPIWIQLEHEIRADWEALEAFLERTAGELERRAARILQASEASSQRPEAAEMATAHQPTPASGRRRWWPFGRGQAHASASERGMHRLQRRWWPFGRGGAGATAPARALVPSSSSRYSPPGTLADLETQRRRTRQRYLQLAAEIDRKIVEYNLYRPRQLSWLEKPRLLPEQAARRFDARCPPMNTRRRASA